MFKILLTRFNKSFDLSLLDLMTDFTKDKLIPYWNQYSYKQYGSHIQRYMLIKDIGLLNQFKFILYIGYYFYLGNN